MSGPETVPASHAAKRAGELAPRRIEPQGRVLVPAERWAQVEAMESAHAELKLAHDQRGDFIEAIGAELSETTAQLEAMTDQYDHAVGMAARVTTERDKARRQATEAQRSLESLRGTYNDLLQSFTALARKHGHTECAGCDGTGEREYVETLCAHSAWEGAPPELVEVDACEDCDGSGFAWEVPA